MTGEAKQKTSESRIESAAQGPIRAVTFDAAGTLLHVREPVGSTYARVAAGFGIPLDPAATDTAFRSAWRARPAPRYPNSRPSEAVDRAWWQSLVLEVLDRCGVPDSVPTDRRIACFDALFTHFADPAAWRLFPEVVDVLDGLADQGIRCLVVSNFDRRLHGILDGLGIRHRFDALILSSESGAAKPDPWIFQRALQAAGHGIEPGDCLHAGDDPVADWQGAARAGLRVYRLQRPESDLTPLLALSPPPDP